MSSTISRALVSHVLKAFILSLILENVSCGIPISNRYKHQEKWLGRHSNAVSSTHTVAKERIFDVIMRANSARTSDGSVPELGQIVSPGSQDEDEVELFQGDIVKTKDIQRALEKSGTDEIILPEWRPATDKRSHRQRRAASSNHLHKWPVVNGSRQVPYVIEASSVPAQSVILQAMTHWTHKVPCVTFVPRTTQKDYISFFAGLGCYSWTGRTGGKQRISIGQGCAVMGVVAHEIGHALGFWHEQSRPDRDNYVRILWENIQTDKEVDFMKVQNSYDLGVPYDLNSLMHFGPSTLAKAKGLNTIIKLDGSTDFGQANGLSDNDAQQARLFLCPGTHACKKLYKDSRQECEAWSNQGHCQNDTHKEFMKANCQKSCVCQVCEDKHANCMTYVAGGYCSHPSYKLFMSMNCRKGCRFCEPVS